MSSTAPTQHQQTAALPGTRLMGWTVAGVLLGIALGAALGLARGEGLTGPLTAGVAAIIAAVLPLAVLLQSRPGFNPVLVLAVSGGRMLLLLAFGLAAFLALQPDPVAFWITVLLSGLFALAAEVAVVLRTLPAQSSGAARS